MNYRCVFWAISAHVLALLIVSSADTSISTITCEAAFQENTAIFTEASGAPTSVGEMNQDTHSAPASEWVARRFQIAENQIRECWNRGGRYWEIEAHKRAYLSDVRFAGSEDRMMDVLNEVRARLFKLPEFIRCGLCAPEICEPDDIRTRVFPKYLARLLHFEFVLPPLSDKVCWVKEFDVWHNLKIDFAIVGAGHCGTTSLRTNFAQHPDVIFRVLNEDSWLSRHDRVLPFKEDIDSLNAEWLERAKLRNDATRSVNGLAHPGIFMDPRAQQILMRIPNLRALLVVCDPVGRLEKHFWSWYQCHLRPRVRSPKCWPSLGAVLRDWPDMMGRDVFQGHLLEFQSMLGEKLLLLHQSSLKFDARNAYNNMAAFIGTSPFPLDFEFKRYNSQLGHRSELCKNASVFMAAQRHVAKEYEVLEASFEIAGIPIPEELNQRTTRCDRAEELSEQS